MRNEEHKIQCQIVALCRLKGFTIFSVPNHGIRTPRLGHYFKEEGLLPGVADLFLMLPKETSHGVFIEVKSEKGKQTKTQSDFEIKCTKLGYRYWIIKSIEEFIKKLSNYELT